MEHIFKRTKFINELWVKGLTRNKNGEERIENRLGNHSFTDGNGKFHKYGIKVESKKDFLNVCGEIISNNIDKSIIDLNVIDMSEVDNMDYFFNNLFYDILDSKYGIKNNITIDTSGWVFNKCKSFKGFLSNFNENSIIINGINNWKINQDNYTIKLEDLKNGYYGTYLQIPDWFIFDIKDYIKCCAKTVSHNKYGIDKELTKKLGKKSYWIIFTERKLHIPFIPDNVIIKDIISENESYISVKIGNLTTFNNLPKKFTTRINLELNLDNVIDKHITIPENVTLLDIGKSSNIKILPKELNCGIVLQSDNQLNHFTKINGDFYMNNNTNIISLKGCPKIVTGVCDVHFTKIVDLVGSPEEIGKNFSCSNTKTLKSLKGCPKKINGDFNIYSTGLTDIDDFPEYIGGNINMSGCHNLNSFKGLPKKINGNLDIGYCDVKSLDGLPDEIGGYLIIGNLRLNGKNIDKYDILELYPDIKCKGIKNSQYD